MVMIYFFSVGIFDMYLTNCNWCGVKSALRTCSHKTNWNIKLSFVWSAGAFLSFIKKSAFTYVTCISGNQVFCSFLGYI